MRKTTIALMLTAAGLAAPAMAQDSVGKVGGLPGDSLEVWSTGVHQRASYVVDLTPFRSTTGKFFGIAPIIKASKASPTFYSSLLSGQTISQTMRFEVPSFANSYSAWRGQGGGVHPSENDASFNVTLPGLQSSTQFGVAFAEFATSAGNFNVNNIIGGIVNFNPADPGRLYVTRVNAAINTPSGSAGDTAQFGMGGVDSNGNIMFRADANGVLGAPAIAANNYFRVSMDQRNPANLNQIRGPLAVGLNTGSVSDVGSTDWLINSTTTHNTPTLLPENRSTSGDGRLMGSNFSRNYVYENAPGATTGVATHRAPSGLDHRGGVSFSQATVFPGTVGTGAIIGKLQLDPSFTELLMVWGVDGGGNVSGTRQFTRPTALVDNLNLPGLTGGAITPWNWAQASGVGDFRHYNSQVAFRGGNGTTSVVRTGQTEALAAATLFAWPTNGAPPTSAQTQANPYNAIAVVKWDPTNANSAPAWTLIGWTDVNLGTGLPDGKIIRGDYGNDGFPFTSDAGEFDGVIDDQDAAIGRQASLFELTGGAPSGPSISPPAFDANGNAYFVGTGVIRKRLQDGSTFEDFDNMLFRAVYDQASFSWQLEVLVEVGDTFFGRNSQTRYQVQFIDLADNDSTSSGTFFSNNAIVSAFNGENPGDFANEQSRTLGGLVLNASIVYDYDNDGDYNSPTGTNPQEPTSPDQQYGALMYIGYVPCPADFDGSGFLDSDDFVTFVSQFSLGCDGAGSPDPACIKSADFDGSGFVDSDDFVSYVNAFETGC